MTHIMKLNAEISAASEHWERQTHLNKEEFEKERNHVNEMFKKAEGQLSHKVQALKRKVIEKESLI